MMRLLCTLSLAMTVAAAAVTPVAAQTAPAQGSGAKPGTAAKPAAPATKKAGMAAGRTIEITGGDDMKFSVTSIAAKPGEVIRVVLKSVGKIPKVAMGHNFVALKAGVDAAKFSQDAMTARDTEYVPASRKADILAATALAGPGESVEVTFKAPAKAGSYPYVCSFPGHFAAGMRGDLVVK